MPPEAAPTSPGIPANSVAVTVSDGAVECAQVDGRHFGCSDLSVRLTPPGERVSLPVQAVWELAPATAAPARALIGLDVGLVARPAGLGAEAGIRWYPRALAWSGRLGEVRLGAYGRVESAAGEIAGAAGASILLGAGR